VDNRGGGRIRTRQKKSKTSYQGGKKKGGGGQTRFCWGVGGEKTDERGGGYWGPAQPQEETRKKKRTIKVLLFRRKGDNQAWWDRKKKAGEKRSLSFKDDNGYLFWEAARQEGLPKTKKSRRPLRSGKRGRINCPVRKGLGRGRDIPTKKGAQAERNALGWVTA